MGGGGGRHRGLTVEDLAGLSDLARRRLRSADQDRRNVFISFCSEDLRDVNLLRAQAKNEASDIEFNDWSVKEPFESAKADYIKRGIRERIRQSSLTVVYVSDHTYTSRWVDWEVRESLALHKKALAVHKGTKPPARLPAAVTENSIAVVPWSQLADMIRRLKE